MILKTENIKKEFGGHVAVDNVSLTIQKNTLTSIIGPNGAGKTTLFNLLSGQHRPTSGRIILNNKDITDISPALRTRLGMGRSFQITNVFPNLTCYENVRLAVQSQAGIRYNFFSNFLNLKNVDEKTHQILQDVYMEDKVNELAKNLAHGEKRKLEMAMLLALESELLLLDEPTAGMSVEEVPKILELIKKIRDEGDRTILLIEHKIDMVLELSDEIAVLFNGALLAQGNPKEILQNEKVQSAYLGGLYDDVS